MENNEIINPEVVEKVTDVTSTNASKLKNFEKFGILAVASIAAWEFAVKPLAKKIKSRIGKKHGSSKVEKNEQTDEEIDQIDEEIDQIPDIGE